MSLSLRHCCQGIAGATGAPRPALVNSLFGFSVLEHDSVTAKSSAPSTARATLNSVVFDIPILGRHYSAHATNDSPDDRSSSPRRDVGFTNSASYSASGKA